MTAAVTAELGTGTWAIDQVHSSISFSVRHLMVSNARGVFEDFSGEVVIAEDGAVSVTAEIAVGSVHTANEHRDAHIKAPEYFDVEQYPTATFTSTAVRPEEDHYVLEGEFTLKGVTKPVRMTLTYNGTSPGMGHGEVAGFEASVTLSRKDFAIGPSTVLEGGGVAVGDKVTIVLDIEAKRT